MFYDKQTTLSRQRYIEALTLIGNLSNLFSDSKVPYLYYRIAEKIFCDSFGAFDLSRGDIALDASKDNIGVGLKTFLKNNDKTLQKVAEFNKDRSLYAEKSDSDIVHIIGSLRNERIRFAENVSDVDSSLYHCVIRSGNKFQLFEESMDTINIENIKNIKRQKNSIWFNDNHHEYSFNLSKSTLLKRFNATTFLDEFEVDIFDNPLSKIKECFAREIFTPSTKEQILDTVYLPLYGKDKVVATKSGLNQWNASGRSRNSDEIYIPIPAKVHTHAPSFFPSRDVPFSLSLPDGKTLDAKVCQDNNKALMSNPNKDLGRWLLRDVLELEEGELLTYNKLQKIGIDSVKIDKIDDNNYKISFAAIDSYEDYIATPY